MISDGTRAPHSVHFKMMGRGLVQPPRTVRRRISEYARFLPAERTKSRLVNRGGLQKYGKHRISIFSLRGDHRHTRLSSFWTFELNWSRNPRPAKRGYCWHALVNHSEVAKVAVFDKANTVVPDQLSCVQPFQLQEHIRCHSLAIRSKYKHRGQHGTRYSVRCTRENRTL